MLAYACARTPHLALELSEKNKNDAKKPIKKSHFGHGWPAAAMTKQSNCGMQKLGE
jgi:hypothetical protein